MVLSKLFDIKHQLLQYASHHNNPLNVGIHLTCIPLLLWTGLVFGAKSGPLLPAPSAAAVASGAPVAVALSKIYQFCPPNVSFLIMVAYNLYYICLDKVSTLITIPLFLGLARHATYFRMTNPNADRIALTIHILAWIAQFIGHGVFEKRAPKLLDNLVQAFVLAPYFVVYEVLFFLGYRPQLKKELDVMVKADIAKFRARKALAKEKK
ncbi:hypothetical protein BX616_002716 [Lobosporangium transversale]|uniref:DUF962 domain protein n=1 Tax=Lobosporangium transversale TaxID=64571 RepID=A0A1Y2H3C4_9FUNG|nr:hypothetical protein BCR41DRAFT_330780 [Lobosporangium transversale]KAF9900084.1 hypothetical protein BX616_002716 [Lobosporangium transversale]ORZ28213.1 hypothetical protein BCR41DRAFT_330780 [Lobosporangium transversale]|eukprot:XP_021885898.1 hypothetical protein BCR41DRAFT_330780 [Lobosporangium transversale]